MGTAAMQTSPFYAAMCGLNCSASSAEKLLFVTNMAFLDKRCQQLQQVRSSWAPQPSRRQCETGPTQPAQPTAAARRCRAPGAGLCSQGQLRLPLLLQSASEHQRAKTFP